MTELQKELATALARAQGKIENAKKGNLNPHFKSRYADLAAVWDAVREPFTSEGLSVVQLPVEAPEGKVGLATTILHSSGQCISSVFYMPVSKANDPQAVGSALTYAKRYALLGAAGIAPEDDDGNAATGRQVAASTTSAKDWTSTIMSTLAELKAMTDETAMRTLYSTVRGSSIDEPAKTQLLTQMAEHIKSRIQESKVSK